MRSGNIKLSEDILYILKVILEANPNEKSIDNIITLFWKRGNYVGDAGRVMIANHLLSLNQGFYEGDR